MEKELFALWAGRWPEYDAGLLRELAAEVSRALLKGPDAAGGETGLNKLSRHLKRAALAERPPREAWGFLWALEKSGRAAWPGGLAEWLAVWPPIIDRAAEEYLKAADDLRRLRLDEEIRALHLFLKRAGFNLGRLADLNQKGPFCQPPQAKAFENDE